MDKDAIRVDQNKRWGITFKLMLLAFLYTSLIERFPIKGLGRRKTWVFPRQRIGARCNTKRGSRVEFSTLCVRVGHFFVDKE